MLRQQSLQARHLSELILLSFILVNLEVLERVGILGGGNNTAGKSIYDISAATCELTGGNSQKSSSSSASL